MNSNDSERTRELVAAVVAILTDPTDERCSLTMTHPQHRLYFYNKHGQIVVGLNDDGINRSELITHLQQLCSEKDSRTDWDDVWHVETGTITSIPGTDHQLQFVILSIAGQVNSFYLSA